MNPLYLFVYGSLRRNSGSGMNRLLAPYGHYVADAAYRGRLYRVANYPGAVPSEHPTDVVHGEVWELSHPETAFLQLDAYEACGNGFPEPAEYVRRPVDVTLAGGGTVSAWIYLYNRPTAGLELLAHGDFLRHERENG